MIPRTKVNYTFISLMNALFTSEREEYFRRRIIHHLGCFLGSPHILLTGSGRGALYLLLLALPHRKVFIPAYTCKTVAEAALLAGKKFFLVNLSLMDSIWILTKYLKHGLIKIQYWY